MCVQCDICLIVCSALHIVSRNKKQEPKLDNKDKQNKGNKIHSRSCSSTFVNIPVSFLCTYYTGTQNLYAAQLYHNEGVYPFNNIAAVTVTLHHPVYILVSDF